VCDRCKVDPWTYAANWSTDVRVVGYAIGDGEVRLWHPEDPLPRELFDAFERGSPIISYDAPFHRAVCIGIMGPRYGWPVPPFEQWVCTAAMAAAMDLPHGLDNAAKAMRIAECKDREDQSILLKMARPRSKTPYRCNICGMMTCAHHKMFKTTLTWWSDPENLARLDSCCVQDVRTGRRALFGVLRPLSQSKRENWLRDQTANECGLLTLVSELAGGVAGAPAGTTTAEPQGAAEIVSEWIEGTSSSSTCWRSRSLSRGRLSSPALARIPMRLTHGPESLGTHCHPK